MNLKIKLFIIALMTFSIILPASAGAYIGPGAGLVVGISLYSFLIVVLSSILAFIGWPLRYLLRIIRGRNGYKKARFKKVVIVGFDGLDFHLTQKWMQEGRLPHFQKLKDQGCFKPLLTTTPPISPVAWSSFQTGVNPGKHNIFDFLRPHRQSGAPKLSSVDMSLSRTRIKIGRYAIPLGPPNLRMMRKSVPFWKILGEYGIFSNIIRVPISFPPEKFFGAQLSAMCVPDLRGTQGTCSIFSSNPTAFLKENISGIEKLNLTQQGNKFIGYLLGPENPFLWVKTITKSKVEVRIVDDTTVQIKTNHDAQSLKIGQLSDWMTMTFKCGLGFSIFGMCQFLVRSIKPDMVVYVSPIHIHPVKPVTPISHPSIYAQYLAKKYGLFATLGLAEDTWALNEGILNNDDFFNQCMNFESEREHMLFDALHMTQRGLCICVLDGTDRIQHTFWRQMDSHHPANHDQPHVEQHSKIERIYQNADRILGKVMDTCCFDQDLLMVISDHGFCSFRYGIDLNRWLEENGYLVLESDGRNKKNLTGIQWSHTKAFALGLAGIYINTIGRTSYGIVKPGSEASQLAKEIAEKLKNLKDIKRNQLVIKQVYLARDIYYGPYLEEAPDVIIGYYPGYRAAWETAIGQVTTEIIHANHKAWSGDHCVDPSCVPGVLLCNHDISSENPSIMDIAPTLLSNFGIPVPNYMDGNVLQIKG